jgi:hypothetical protein
MEQIGLRSGEEGPQLLAVPDPFTGLAAHLLGGRRLGEVGHVAGEVPALERVLQRFPDDSVDVPDALGSEPLVPFGRTVVLSARRSGGAALPRSPAVALQLSVQPVEVLGSERLEPQAGDAPRQHVGVDDLPVLRLGVGPQAAAIDPAGQVLPEGEIGRLDVAAGVDVAEQAAEQTLGLLPRLRTAAPLLDPARVVATQVRHEGPRER